MLLKFLGCMVLAAIIEYILLRSIIKYYEQRFLNQANSICMLYECIYPMLEDDFNNDKKMKVFVKFKHGKCKIKFRNAVEAGLNFELLVQKAFKSYRVVEFVMSMVNQDTSGTDMFECKQDLEKICCEVRTLVNEAQEKNIKEL